MFVAGCTLISDDSRPCEGCNIVGTVLVHGHLGRTLLVDPVVGLYAGDASVLTVFVSRAYQNSTSLGCNAPLVLCWSVVTVQAPTV